MLGLLRSFFGLESGSTSGVLDDARAMSWPQIHAIVRDGFRRRGFLVSDPPAGASDAIDLVVRRNGESFLVHCKQWKSATVGAKTIRKLVTELVSHDAAGGFVLCVGSYAEDARELAKNAGVELFDSHEVEQLILDARRPEPFLDPTEGRRQTSFKNRAIEPLCPTCGGGMVKRTAIRGGEKGNDFWGCLQYPHCRGMLDIK